MISVRWQSVVLGLLVAGLGFGGVGCKQKPGKGGNMLADEKLGTIGEDPLAGGAGDLPDREAMAGEGQRGMFPAVYFDYDSALMRGGEEAKLQAVAGYLRDNTAASVTVEGHCDERGSNEYNISLGDRRAMAVRAALIGLGVDGSRIEPKSMGEEMPAAPGHDEASWAQNRRAEFVVR